MEIIMTIRELNNKAPDFDAICNDIGLSPWCMNEGLATGDEEQKIPEDIARKHGLI